MKNVILAIFGFMITLYTFSLMFSVLSLETRKNSLENHVARVVEGFLESAYQTGSEQEVRQRLVWELSQNIDDSGSLTVDVLALDLQKGIISVKVSEAFRQFNGRMRTIVCEKTAIMEQPSVQESKVIVTFKSEGRLYKEYQVEVGEGCPVPRLPEGTFIGWAEEGDLTQELVTSIAQVWEDKTYVAVKN